MGAAPRSGRAGAEPSRPRRAGRRPSARARAIYATLKRDADVPIEFAANIGLLLLGVRRLVQLDRLSELGGRSDPRAARRPPAARGPVKSQLTTILAHCEGELVVADPGAGGA